MTARDNPIIRETAENIQKRYRPEKIILFGSWALGSADKNSDIDLFVVKNTSEKFLARTKRVRKIIGPQAAADIIVYTPKELRESLNAGDFFTRDIVKSGKVLYDKKS